MITRLIKNSPIILCLVMALYGPVVLLTNYSLTGFWTDLVFSISLFCVCSIMVFRRGYQKPWVTIALRTTTISFIVVVVKFLSPLQTPFFSDVFKLRSFYLQRIDNRLFNAYFKPVGAYSGGYGNFYITESPLYFPLIEKLVYYDRTMHHDFCDDTFEGEPIDNSEVVRQIITEEIIDRENL